MSQTYTQDQTFEKIDFSENPLPKGEYENCTFTNCIFANADISNIKFVDSEFTNCDMTMANISATGLQDIKFNDCKLLGLHFENCTDFLFSVSFGGCNLNLASFYKRKIKKVTFKACTLVETDFSEADLNMAIFDNCDLSGAIFDRTNLEKADFRTSFNFSIDPERNPLKKAKFSKSELSGLLDKYKLDIE